MTKTETTKWMVLNRTSAPPNAPDEYFERPITYRVDRYHSSRGGWQLRQYRGSECVLDVWLGTEANLHAERWASENRGFKKQEDSL